MEDQYVINGSTLEDTADAIRTMTGKEGSINPLNFPEEILSIDLSTETYMRISDLTEYPEPIDEDNYTEEEIAKVDALIEFYSEMEVENNGE